MLNIEVTLPLRSLYVVADFLINAIAQNRTPTPIDAWSATTPAERLPYAAQIQEAIAEYKADLQAFNARIPLSPLVQFCLSVFNSPTQKKKHTHANYEGVSSTPKRIRTTTVNPHGESARRNGTDTDATISKLAEEVP